MSFWIINQKHFILSQKKKKKTNIYKYNKILKIFYFMIKQI